MRRSLAIIITMCAVVAATCALYALWPRPLSEPARVMATPLVAEDTLSPFQRALLHDLVRQTGAHIRYKDGYYQGGEPPADVGVCTDVVVRAFRAAGIDLRQAVAADMRAHPGDYAVRRIDPNIDHRRCRNLRRFFARYARRLRNDGEWQPGDVVFVDTAGTGKPDHVAMIGNHRDADGQPAVIQAWPGQCVAEARVLGSFSVTDHFRAALGP